ncbi:5-formyltetrahydrofolate cyclo-ligase [Undibacterium sp.]|jgi:5-formyltetrahydrofolate cyclo-ligase|uniref:5-formyltetrahydrofolate cyclo-ligase n=1 Tax=Undibacterium sp. TaxID=1914977 RepID=UPI002C840B59|nr:5-formyltetrahydrofolate cyclo-ligase [Undibacterium sp.]HTD07178.1 5-formyltetrahydrofolate cyclo-ligase [Undibacterium sp.]
MTHPNSISRPAAAETPEQAAAQKPGSAPDKAALRRQLLQARLAVDPATRQAWDQQIAARLQQWCRQHKPRSMGVYWPIQAEPDLLALYPALAAAGIQLALPIVQARNAPLTFAQWTPGDAMEKDGYGIPIPAVRDSTIWPDVLLIPCVGFSLGKFRLGYGGGYYDRTLAAAPHTAAMTAIGIGYQCGLAEFATEPHDAALDVVLTESACLA